MIAFFNGRYGLAPTFLIGVLGAWVVFRLAQVILTGSLDFTDLEAVEANLSRERALVFVAAAYGLVALRAVWLSSGRDGKRTAAGILLVILAAIVAALTIRIALVTAMPGSFTTRSMVEAEVAEINRAAPMRIGDHLTLEGARIDSDEMVYLYRSAREIGEAEVATLVARVQNVDSVDGRQFCADNQGVFSQGINALRFEYAFVNQTVIGRVTAAACAAVLR